MRGLRERGARGERAGWLWALAVVLSAAFVIGAAALLYFVAFGGPHEGPAPSGEQTVSEEVTPASFETYTWGELSQVAHLIADAGSDEEGREVAERYGVAVGSVRPVSLADGTVVEARVVGLRHDSRSDGLGKAGITLMLTPVALRPVNSTATAAGGWEASELRAWLQGEGRALLPEDLAEAVVPVAKATNNVGVSGDPSSVTVTSDELWCFSVTEVCGGVSWFSDEFGSTRSALTGYTDFPALDALLSSEGAQYEYFAQAGVTGASDPSGTLELAYRGAKVAWWYRTPYPYSFDGSDEPYFYQVMDSGYPSSVGKADAPAGVTLGLCL